MAEANELVIRMQIPEDTPREILDELRNDTFALGRISLGSYAFELNGRASLAEITHAPAPIINDPVHLGIKARG